MKRRPDGGPIPIEPPFPLSVPVEFVRSSRARRISLRLDTSGRRAVLTAPHALPRSRALEFLARHEVWLKARLAKLPQAMPFADAAIVPILGLPHRVVADAGRLRGRVERRDGTILVPGAPEHLARRLTDYLKAEAKREIAVRARCKAAELGVRIAAVTVRDTKTRWGSCTRSGRLSFSWRLILAPESVLDYVAAHEVAHLVELNHGPKFWALCATLTEDAATARAWLKRHGTELHRYG